MGEVQSGLQGAVLTRPAVTTDHDGVDLEPILLGAEPAAPVSQSPRPGS